MFNINPEIVLRVVYSPARKWQMQHNPAVGILWPPVCLPGSPLWSPRGGISKHDNQGGRGGPGIPRRKYVPDHCECIASFVYIRWPSFVWSLFWFAEFVCVCVSTDTVPQDQPAFGPAQIAVTREEFDWMQRFLKIRRRLPGGSTAKYYFFTSTSKICKKLVTYFRAAWKSMGLTGSPNFTDLRTSIASHVTVFSR